MERHCSGSAGRIENCQVVVFLGYAMSTGRALLDRELYFPKERGGDTERREQDGVPGDVDFATNLVLARRMVERAVAAGVPASLNLPTTYLSPCEMLPEPSFGYTPSESSLMCQALISLLHVASAILSVVTKPAREILT